MELPLGASRLGVEPPDPVLRARQIAGLRCHYQNGAKPGVGDEPDTALERSLFFGRENRFQFLDHFFRLGRSHRDDGKRHALHDIDVEHRNRVEHAFDFRRRPLERDDVARIVGLHDGAFRHHRLEHTGDFGRGDKFQGNDANAVAGDGAFGRAVAGSDHAGGGLVGR